MLYGLPHLIELVEAFTEVHEQRVLTVATPLHQSRHAFEGVSRRHEIACIASLIRQLGGQTFHVPNTLQGRPQSVQPASGTGQRTHGLVACLNRFHVREWVQEPCFEQATPHGRPAPIEG